MKNSDSSIACSSRMQNSPQQIHRIVLLCLAWTFAVIFPAASLGGLAAASHQTTVEDGNEKSVSLRRGDEEGGDGNSVSRIPRVDKEGGDGNFVALRPRADKKGRDGNAVARRRLDTKVGDGNAVARRPSVERKGGNGNAVSRGRVDIFKTRTESAPSCQVEFSTEEEIDFTLVSQLSPNRFYMMKELCQRWGPHPISIAVAVEGSERAIVKALEGMGCLKEHLKVQVIHDFQSDMQYPINRLRNLALAGVETSHAVYIDIDFLPSPDLYESLKFHRHALLDPKLALVIPAFELQPLCTTDDTNCMSLHHSIMPKTKDELIDLFNESNGHPAIAKFDSNSQGHSSTRYQEWMTTQSPEELLPIQCLKSRLYEPFLVFRYCNDLPPFQERFEGYGKNKISWMQQMHRTGHRLEQLGDSFLVHFPHRKSDAFRRWNNIKRKDGRGGLDSEMIHRRFLHWMWRSIPDQSVIPYCDEDEETS